MVRHSEDPKLIHGTEAVLERADEAKVGVRIAFKLKHRVDDMLEHPRPGKRPFFRDMADKNKRRT